MPGLFILGNMVVPQQGIHDSGRIGFCPHCLNSNIRIRQGRHDSQLWRCRECNRTFPTPLIKETWFVKSNVKNYVFESDIPRLEGRTRRRRQGSRARRPRRGNSNKALVVLSIILIALATAAAAWWLLPTFELGGRNVPRKDGTNSESAVRTSQPILSSYPAPSEGFSQPPKPPPPTTTTSQSERLAATRDGPPAPVLTTPLIPTPVLLPDSRHMEEKLYMLQLINSERTRAGAGSVVLGDNIAAQIHAETALANCFSSHWGLDGLKPYMRYSLAGGYQSNGENGHGSDYCIKESDQYLPVTDIQGEIREAVAGWMNSPGHRRNMLNPSHKKVNIGIAWDRYNVKAFQHFEGDYVEYARLPEIHEGVLTLAGRTTNEARLGGRRDLDVQIYYDPPPEPLTLGQVARTLLLRQRLTCGQLARAVDGRELLDRKPICYNAFLMPRPG